MRNAMRLRLEYVMLPYSRSFVLAYPSLDRPRWLGNNYVTIFFTCHMKQVLRCCRFQEDSERLFKWVLSPVSQTLPWLDTPKRRAWWWVKGRTQDLKLTTPKLDLAVQTQPTANCDPTIADGGRSRGHSLPPFVPPASLYLRTPRCIRVCPRIRGQGLVPGWKGERGVEGRRRIFQASKVVMEP